jgi:hypothetical protein
MLGAQRRHVREHYSPRERDCGTSPRQPPTILPHPRDASELHILNRACVERPVGASIDLCRIDESAKSSSSSPLLRMLGVETESASYLLADTILTYAFWFIYGSCFHFAAKIVGGHGNYTSSLVSFLYLTAFMPVITTILIPVDVIVRRHIVHTADTTSPGFLQFVAADLLASTPALISLTIGLVASIWYLAALSRVFRLVHGVGRVRGVAIVIIGMGIWQILSWFIEIPAFQLFYKAYQTHGA